MQNIKCIFYILLSGTFFTKLQLQCFGKSFMIWDCLTIYGVAAFMHNVQYLKPEAQLLQRDALARGVNNMPDNDFAHKIES